MRYQQIFFVNESYVRQLVALLFFLAPKSPDGTFLLRLFCFFFIIQEY